MFEAYAHGVVGICQCVAPRSSSTKIGGRIGAADSSVRVEVVGHVSTSPLVAQVNIELSRLAVVVGRVQVDAKGVTTQNTICGIVVGVFRYLSRNTKGQMLIGLPVGASFDKLLLSRGIKERVKTRKISAIQALGVQRRCVVEC